jgi:hypothetical protein
MATLTAAERDQYVARLSRYEQMELAYEGKKVRTRNNILPDDQVGTIKFNFNRPIVNMALAWIAAPPISWRVRGEAEKATKDLSQQAADIWDRSQGPTQFLEASQNCLIHGDMVGLVRSVAKLQMADGELLEAETRIEFHSAHRCMPHFDPSDCSRLLELSIVYDTPGSNGKPIKHEERWGQTHLDIYLDGELSSTMPYGNEWVEVPAVWIRNEGLKGQLFGTSELANVHELVHMYDHIAGGETSVIDYHSKPNLVFKGVTKPASDLEKTHRTTYYLPADGDAFFLELDSDAERVDRHLVRLKQAIQEISETPAIAFGQIDDGFSSATGISLKVLYGPLNKKTARKRAMWGPQLQRLMRMALKQDGSEVTDEQVDIVWQDATPENELEVLEALESKKRLGVSARQALIEAGYDNAEVDQMLKDRAAEEDEALARAQRAFDSGGSRKE